MHEKGEVMDMMIDLLFGLLRLFVQPLFYLLLAFAVLVNYRRVRQERRDFHVRIYGVFDGLMESILPGLIAGLAGSVVLVAVGIMLPPGMIVFIAIFYLVAMLTFQLRLVSPVLTVGAAALCAYWLPAVTTGVPLLDNWIDGIRERPISSTVLLLGLLIVLEGFLIRFRGVKTNPRLMPGRRGKTVGAHEARKLWFVPLCLLLPGGVIPSMGLWPLAGQENDGFSILLVPFGFGFYRLITDSAPKQVVISVAKQRLWLGVVVVALAAGAIYSDIEWLAVGAAAISVLFGLWNLLLRRFFRKRESFYFSQRDDGLTVLGVLPGSPAEKLGVRVGECIRKVNGEQVREEGDFYRALQGNAAYCKMEVLDESGEVRFVQGALYEGAHHELGLLFVAPPKAAL
ncbi:MAG TPA: PDZ domain-containing protein [Bacillales bacterium]|nr:PDZ domain-containing protein [Bacillales bacterium]